MRFLILLEYCSFFKKINFAQTVLPMIRTTLTPEQQDISINLHVPKSYVGKKVEVLLYAYDEPKEEQQFVKKSVVNSHDALKSTDEKALLIKEIKQSVEEMKLVRAGKLKARPIEDLLNEL